MIPGSCCLQLAQIQVAVAASSPGNDLDNLVSLQKDIEELITLTKENLSTLQNQASSSQDAADEFDEQYALFKVSARETVLELQPCSDYSSTDSCNWCGPQFPLGNISLLLLLGAIYKLHHTNFMIFLPLPSLCQRFHISYLV